MRETERKAACWGEIERVPCPRNARSRCAHAELNRTLTSFAITNATAPAPHPSQPKQRRAGMKVTFALEENEEHEWDEDLEALAQVRAIGRAVAGARR